MIKFIKNLFAPAVKVETPIAEYKVEAPAVETFPVPKEAKASKPKKASVKKATTRKPRTPKAPK